MPNIKLRSSDGVDFEVNAEVIKYSNVLTSMSSDDEVVQLPNNINAEVIQKMIEWAHYHKDHPLPPGFTTDGIYDNNSQWDLDFVAKIETDTLFGMIFAVEHLEMIPLKAVLVKSIMRNMARCFPDEVMEGFFNRDKPERENIISASLKTYVASLE